MNRLDIVSGTVRKVYIDLAITFVQNDTHVMGYGLFWRKMQKNGIPIAISTFQVPDAIVEICPTLLELYFVMRSGYVYRFAPETGTQLFQSVPFVAFAAFPLAWIGATSNHTVLYTNGNLRQQWNFSEPIQRVVSSYLNNAIMISSDNIYSWGNSPVAGDGTRLRLLQKPAHVNLRFVNVKMGDIVTAVVGEADTLLLLRDGTIYAWGTNTFGTLGFGTTLPVLLPTRVPLEQKISHLACYTSCIAVTFQGELLTWGYTRISDKGTQQPISFIDYPSFQQDPPVAISGNWNTFMLFTQNKKMLGWGINTFGL